MNTRCPFTAICFDAECTIINIKKLYWFQEKEKSHPTVGFCVSLRIRVSGEKKQPEKPTVRAPSGVRSGAKSHKDFCALP